MNMNRLLWTQTLTEHYCPPWPCPTCKKGVLALVPKSFLKKETVNSKRAHRMPDWDPDWIEYVFTAWAKCGNPSCGEEAALGGVGGMEPEYDQEGAMDWSHYYAPRFCRPMPDIFDIPEKCPDEVTHELRAGFAIFWADGAACAGRVRVALERLMDHLGVAQQITKGKRIIELNLHQRIETFALSEPTLAMHLMALKWLGNTGSHQGRVARTDLLDAFQILEHALVELIDRRTAKVAELAQKLTKKHAPRKKASP